MLSSETINYNNNQGKNYGELRRGWLYLRQNKLAMVGLAIILLYFFCAIFAPIISPYDPLQTDYTRVLESPSSQNILGTDWLGRDVLSRIIYGSRISLAIGFISVAIGMLIGIPIGALSGYYGGKFDIISQRFIDILLAFPGILLAIVVVAIMGVGIRNVMIAVGIVSIPIYARLVRGAVMAVKEQGFILAAEALGIRNYRIITRHVLPNCLGPIIVQSTFQIATAILWAAGLGFLGLGAQPPDPEWGAMLSTGREYIRVAHHLTTYPGLTILLMVLGFNLIGDGLRDALDPRSREYKEPKNRYFKL